MRVEEEEEEAPTKKISPLHFLRLHFIIFSSFLVVLSIFYFLNFTSANTHTHVSRSLSFLSTFKEESTFVCRHRYGALPWNLTALPRVYPPAGQDQYEIFQRLFHRLLQQRTAQ